MANVMRIDTEVFELCSGNFPRATTYLHRNNFRKTLSTGKATIALT